MNWFSLEHFLKIPLSFSLFYFLIKKGNKFYKNSKIKSHKSAANFRAELGHKTDKKVLIIAYKFPLFNVSKKTTKFPKKTFESKFSNF